MASRKRISRESANIIKIKAAQDRSNWDLKEKLHQLEVNHERLQQNMVEVMMQHETVSEKYQEELRLRHDTLNKLSGTREICDVLEEYGERLRRTLSRCRTDQQKISDAYGACGARVRLLAADLSRTRVALREQRAATRLATEHAQADARLLQQLTEQLGDAGARDALLQQKCRELTERLVRYDTELRQREETVAALQADAARTALELQAGATELQRAAETHRRQIEAAQERTEAERAARNASELRAAGLEQELRAERALRSLPVLSHTTGVWDELINTSVRCGLLWQAALAGAQEAQVTQRIDAVQERPEVERAARNASELRVAGLEHELTAAQDLILQLRAERAKAVTTIEQTKTELALLADDKKVMQKAIQESNQWVMTLETEISCLKDRLLEMETQLLFLQQELSEQLGSADQLLAAEREQLQERSQQLQTLQAALAEEQEAPATQRIDAVQERPEVERAARNASELRVAGLEHELTAAQDLILQLRAERAKAVTTTEQTKTEYALLADDKKVMQKAIQESNQWVMTLETEISCLKDRLLEMETQLLFLQQELSEQLGSANQLLAAEREQLQERSQQLQTLQAALAEEQEAHATQRAADAKKLEELGGVVAESNRQLELKSGTVARLMEDLGAEAQARYRAESRLSAKDDELAKQMAIILELRAEKEKIAGLQASMENVRKELTGPALPQGPARGQAPAKRDADDLLYSFLSDGNVDSDALDARKVTRFEAMKRGSRSMSLAQIKKELSVKNRKFFKTKRPGTSCKE